MKTNNTEKQSIKKLNNKLDLEKEKIQELTLKKDSQLKNSDSKSNMFCLVHKEAKKNLEEKQQVINQQTIDTNKTQKIETNNPKSFKNFIKNLTNKFNQKMFSYFHQKVENTQFSSLSQEITIDKNAIIEIKNLYMKYNKKRDWTINDCNFMIPKGDFHVFIGQNGSGKSTIIRMLIGLNNDYQGDIFINGINGKNPNSRNNMVFIPDKPIFPNEFNTFDYLFNSALLINQNKAKIKEQINKLLEEFDITHIKKNNPNKLSSGQKQKVLIIKTLLIKAKIIILDEPTSNLDTITRKQFLEILKKLTIENKVTIFISTHILEEIKLYATGATFIDKGKILWCGKVNKNEIVNKHNKLFGLE